MSVTDTSHRMPAVLSPQERDPQRQFDGVAVAVADRHSAGPAILDTTLLGERRSPQGVLGGRQHVYGGAADHFPAEYPTSCSAACVHPTTVPSASIMAIAASGISRGLTGSASGVWSVFILAIPSMGGAE